MENSSPGDTLVRLFGELVDMDAAQRKAALAAAHERYPGLTADLRTLLIAVERSGPGLTAHLAGLVDDAAADEAGLEPDTRVDRYRIVDELGRGGMGVVYRARRADGTIEQDVAIKISRLRAMDESAVYGLRREAALLSTLRHPGIAQFHDVVTIDDGRLALIVELVDGKPADEWCAEYQPDLAALLGVLLDTARAVHHAHGQRITHGDIKPGNVLVDARGQVRLLDFGIAALLGEADADSTRAFGASPDYSAPEVFEHGVVSIRSDVYSLGVLGRTLLAACADGSARVSRYSRMSDLRAVLERATAADPALRHADMSALIADLEAIAERRPIRSRAGNVAYRGWRLLQRRPGMVAVATFAVLALIGGVAEIGLAQRSAQLHARELEKVAQFQVSQLSGIDPGTMGMGVRNDLIARHREMLTHSSGQADAAGSAATDAAVAAFEQSLDGINFTDLALQTLQVNIFDRSLQAIDRQFGDEPMLKARLFQTVADSMHELDLTERAMIPQQQAWDIRRGLLGEEHPDTLTSLNGLGSLIGARGDLGKAESVLRSALASRRRVLGADHPDTLTTMSEMGMILRMRGNMAEAEPLIRDTLRRRQQVLGPDAKETFSSTLELIVVLRDLGNLPEAERYNRELLESSRRLLGDDDRSTLFDANMLGLILMDRGRYAEAEPLFEETLRTQRRILGNEHYETLASISNLCSLNMRRNRLAEAEPLCREVFDTNRRILGLRHPATLTSLNNLANLKYREGNLEEAEQYLSQAEQVSRAVLGDRHPDTLLRITSLGNLLRKLGRLEESERLLEEAVRSSRDVLPSGHRNIGFFLSGHARTLSALQRFSEAQDEMLEAYETLLHTESPDETLMRDTVLALVQLYENWDRAAPGNGHAASAAEWRAKQSEIGGAETGAH